MALLIRLAIHSMRENVVPSGWLGHVRRAQKLDNYSAILKCIETQNGEKYFLKKHFESLGRLNAFCFQNKKQLS